MLDGTINQALPVNFFGTLARQKRNRRINALLKTYAAENKEMELS